jgi:hypothetical protein
MYALAVRFEYYDVQEVTPLYHHWSSLVTGHGTGLDYNDYL